MVIVVSQFVVAEHRTSMLGLPDLHGVYEIHGARDGGSSASAVAGVL